MQACYKSEFFVMIRKDRLHDTSAEKSVLHLFFLDFKVASDSEKTTVSVMSSIILFEVPDISTKL